MHHSISFLFRLVYALVFGSVLLLHTEEIVHYVPQLVGSLLILESVGKMVELTVLKFRTEVSAGFYAVPLLALLFGLYLTFLCEMPEISLFMTGISDISELALFKVKMKVAGACFFALVAEELVTSLVFFKPLYRPEKFAEERRQRLEAEKALEEARRAADAAAQREAAQPNDKPADPLAL